MKLTKKHLLSGLVTFAMVLMLAVPAIVGATTDDWSLDNFGDTAGLGSESLPNIIGSIINVILSTLGVIAVLIILWGGFIWMTAAGEPDKVDKAKKLIISGIVGLAIIFAAYAIATFVIGALGSATGSTL